MTQNPLESYSSEWVPLQQTMILNRDDVNVYSTAPNVTSNYH
jgi:hypothetical protein